jgi:type IVB pilus formation R64 PilN family outer membrane protein
MNGSNRKVLAAALVTTVMMTGCAGLSQERALGRRDMRGINAARRSNAPEATAALRVNPMPYLLGRTVRVVKPQPAWLHRRITYVSASPQSIYQVASRIGAITGIPVDVRDITQPSNSSTTGSSTTTAIPPTNMPSSMPGGIGGSSTYGAGMNFITAQYPGMVESAVHWPRGTLRGLLDYIASRYGIYWHTENNSIILFKYQTRTYPIGVPIMDSKISNSITGSSGTSSGGSGTSSGSMSVSGKSGLTPYADVVSGVQTIVDAAGPHQGLVVASPALGTVTVTAPPPVQREVNRYLDQQTQEAARNIVVGVKIYSLTLSNHSNLGGSLEIAFKNVRQNLQAKLNGLNLNSVLTSASGGVATGGLGSLSLIVPSTAPGSAARWNGTQAVVDALKSVGTVNLVTSGTVVTSNGQPGPIQVARQIAYLAQASITTTTNAGATTALTPATLTVGFTADFLPRILSHNRIMLSYQMQLSSLRSMSTISSGGSTIQTPQTSTQSASQSVVLRNGQTLVMAGFGQSNHNSGVGIGMLSGYRNHSQSRTWLIILLHVAEVAP